MTDGAVERQAFSVPEFCHAHGISTAHFYILMKQGRAPRIMRPGNRTLISVEAAAEWRRAREAEAEGVPTVARGRAAKIHALKTGASSAEA